MIIPILVTQSPFGGVGDMILVIYLLVLIRFFTSLSGLASGSTFGGMGARRELFISALIEPLILLVLFVMALLAGSTNLGVISTAVATGAASVLRDGLAGDDIVCVCHFRGGRETAL